MRLFLLLVACVAMSGCAQRPAPPPKEEPPPPAETNPEPPPSTETEPEPTPEPSPPDGGCAIAPANGQAAISEAIRGCPDGSTVRFPANGSYTLSDEIVVRDRSDLIIDGNGSTFTTTTPNDSPGFQADAFDPNWLILRGSHVTLRNMKVVGNFKEAGPRYFRGGNQFNPGVFVAGGTGHVVSDVTVNDVWGDMVLVASEGTTTGNVLTGQVPTGTKVQRVTGRRAARMCIAFGSGRNVEVSDSNVSDCWYAGIDFEIDVPGAVLHGAKALRNTVNGTYFAALTVPYVGNAGDVKDIEIRGNTVTAPPDSCFPAIHVKDTRFGRNAGKTVENVVAAGNRVKTRSRGIEYHDVTSGSITGNHVEAVFPAHHCGESPFAPIHAVRSNVAVSGNTSSGY